MNTILLVFIVIDNFKSIQLNMKAMVDFFKKILVFLVTGSISVVLAACYGTPINEMYYRLVKAKTSSGEPIKGLQVKILNKTSEIRSGLTDENGTIGLNIPNEYQLIDCKLVVEDIDGELNFGAFKPQQLPLDNQKEIIVVMEKIVK
jgi:hypothetical protein